MSMNLLFSPVLSAVAPRTGTGEIVYYVLAALLAITVLIGISMMSKVNTAVRGNRLGSISMLLMIVLTLWYWEIFSFAELYIAMLIGAAIGIWISVKVKMIQMPQMVAILNGFGGAASMLAGILTLMAAGDGSSSEIFSLVTAGLAVFVGAFTFTGSMVAAGKLHGVISQKPLVFKRHSLWTGLTIILALVTVVLLSIPDVLSNNVAKTILIILCAIISGLFGVVFAIRVGGADMPITISLLNSFSGVAGAIAGLAIADPLLVAVGAIVGASGLLLTQIMCRSMNRKLMDILLGKTSTPQVKVKKTAVAGATNGAVTVATVETVKECVTTDEEETGPAFAKWLNEAKSVIIVPGYGMALSQAQPLVKNLMDELEEDGKKVEFAIHPVAGRMPGHMNVLLAEVDVPYEKLHEMDEINPEFAETDVAIIIGANDVVNPAANTAEGTPIYGMPILEVENARHVIIMNYDKQPGYAGVDNPLYEEGRSDKVALLLGDAKDSLKTLAREYRLTFRPDKKVVAKDITPAYAQWLDTAEKIIIVPGYGMALSQAQPLVKNLMDELEEDGKNVEFAIHPVAGRMPGHMNVLLAEVDVPYEKLHEMDEINPKFAETDLAIIIGANDVVNPAANTAEGTPIYGMPILEVEAAKHVIIMNYDKQPGYAGVDNPLYEEGRGSQVALLLGDAKESLKKLSKEYRAVKAPATSETEAEDAAPVYTRWIEAAEKIIIVPGYGMALSQAQPVVKQLMDELEQKGKSVEFAIHPVAGRMPGHMNVLLAEVDVPYEKLHEMEEINPKFAETDVAIIIGANDVINPAANTAEGTPIYGMPILNVEDARYVIIMNYDKQPGYAGVDNPLYNEGRDDKIALLLGDATASLKQLLQDLREYCS
ncbi:MAG: NAD(P)(+) transhydrogenase (Re/Si-specific) subunit beta [Eubacteriales bacterium]|nr:NAD(P)(+) transhydrogenase (Re/Si-specific) subunit beta [Eubacteriales bacterium]